MIDVSTMNAFIIWQEINHENGNIYMRQRKKFLISLGKELCGITKEAQPVALVSATRKRKVTLAGNGALLNKRARCTLYHRKKDGKCQSLCSRCGKDVCPEHLDIVCIKCAWFYIVIIFIFLSVYLQVYSRFVLLFAFIWKCF